MRVSPAAGSPTPAPSRSRTLGPPVRVAEARTPTLDGNERMRLLRPSNAVKRHASCARSAASEGAGRFAGGAARLVVLADALVAAGEAHKPATVWQNGCVVNCRQARRVRVAIIARQSARAACGKRDGLEKRRQPALSIDGVKEGGYPALTQHAHLQAKGEREARAEDRNAARRARAVSAHTKGHERVERAPERLSEATWRAAHTRNNCV